MVLIFLGGLALVKAASSSASSSSSASATFTATIPSNHGNIFINETKLPEGTLFIACGSILFGLIIGVLLWRLTTMYQMRRAAKKSEAEFTALTQNTYGGPFVDPVLENEEEVEKRKADAGQPRFFSPINQVLKTGSLVAPMSNSTSYLPSGYYSSGQSIMGGGRPYSMHRDTGISRVSVNDIDDRSIAPTVQTAPLNDTETYGAPRRTTKQRPPSTYLDQLIGH